MLNFGAFLDGPLIVIAVIWCAQMLRRWRSDLAEFRTTTDSMDRVVIASLWAVTGLFLLFLVQWSVSLFRNAGQLRI